MFERAQDYHRLRLRRSDEGHRGQVTGLAIVLLRQLKQAIRVAHEPDFHRNWGQATLALREESVLKLELVVLSKHELLGCLPCQVYLQ